MRLVDVVREIDGICPFSLQEEWDNSGVQVAAAPSGIRTCLVAFDYTEKILEEAVGKNANLIITHHPFFYKPIQHIDVSETKGRLIAGLLRNSISLIACHTNLDKVGYGVSAVLGEKLGLTYCHPFIPESRGIGFGVRGTLPKEVPLADFAEVVKTNLGLKAVRYIGDEKKPVRTIVVMGGAGADYIQEAKAQSADVYVSADFRYHDGQLATEIDLPLIDAGHFATEMFTMAPFAAKLATAMPEVKFIVSKKMKDFWGVR